MYDFSRNFSAEPNAKKNLPVIILRSEGINSKKLFILCS